MRLKSAPEKLKYTAHRYMWQGNFQEHQLYTVCCSYGATAVVVVSGPGAPSALGCTGVICAVGAGWALGSRVFSRSFFTCASNASSSKDDRQHESQHPAVRPLPLPPPYRSVEGIYASMLPQLRRSWATHECRRMQLGPRR